MRTQLVPLDGSPPIEISKELVLIGRLEECDLRLEHNSVSKMHCVLVRSTDSLLVRDLGSTNGTRVNGQRVRRASLMPNDQLSVANFSFRVHIGEDVDASPIINNSRTQLIDSPKVASAVRKAKEKPEVDEPHDNFAPSLHLNQHPDKYPD